MAVYNPNTEKLESKPSNGFSNLVEEFYSRLDSRFPVKWKIKNGIKVPEIEKEKLPEDTTMKDVETVLNNMKSEGWF